MLNTEPKRMFNTSHKTIDELVEYVSKNYNFPNVYNYLIRNLYEELLVILKSKSNIESKYDLMIIKEIEKICRVRLDDMDNYKGWYVCIKCILQFYKDRKVA